MLEFKIKNKLFNHLPLKNGRRHLDHCLKLTLCLHVTKGKECPLFGMIENLVNIKKEKFTNDQH